MSNKIPFNYVEGAPTLHKYLTTVFRALFDNDQRNLLIFAVALAIPGIFLCVIGMLYTSWGHPLLMVFDLLIFIFCGWALYMAGKMYIKTVGMYDKERDKK